MGWASRRLPDDTRLLLLPELLAPLVGTLSEVAEDDAEWLRYNWEEEEGGVL